MLELGLEALERVAQRRPVGYRSPAWDFSPRTVDILIEYGFEYDSSCMAHDFSPYYLRHGDQWSLDTTYQFGEVTPLVEIPVTWGLDDFPVSEFVMGLNAGLRPPSEVEESWRADFDYALAHCVDGVFTLTLHPQTIGRGGRMHLLARLLEYFAGHSVEFKTMADVAAQWQAANPLQDWKQANPLMTGEHAIS